MDGRVRNVVTLTVTIGTGRPVRYSNGDEALEAWREATAREGLAMTETAPGRWTVADDEGNVVVTMVETR